MHDSLKDEFKSLGTNFEFYFGLLYSLYSFPNIILPFVGGLFICKYGPNKVFVVVGIILLIGQFLFALGCHNQQIILMLTGRSIFGLGGEIINIAQNCLILKWFKKNELSFPLGLTITVSRLGSVVNDIASPKISSVI